MLRRPPTPHLLAPQQRAFWSQAVEILSRLKSATTSITSAEVDPDATKSAARDDPPRTSKRTSAWRLRVAADVDLPEFLQTASNGEVASAKKAFTELMRVLKCSRDSKRLLQSWDVVRLCQPFVVEKQGVRLADDGNNTAMGGSAKASGVLQMLPADVFAQRAAGTNCRTLFVSSLEGGEGYVTAANEAVVVALLVQRFYALQDHRKAIEFFEDYSSERRRWLKKRAGAASRADAAATVSTTADEAFLASGDAKQQKESLAFARATRLWLPARCAYLKSLISSGRYHRIVQFVREDLRNLEAACEAVDTMSSVLVGCRKEKDSALARLAIETMSKKNPVHALPLVFYELALKAALQKKARGEGDLENALWVARAMRVDAGYVLHTDLWFALFNTSLHQKREDCAIEVFDMFPSHFASPPHDHFRRAIRKACRRSHPDVVLTMVRHWLAAVDGDASSRVDAESKTKVLEFVLSEMLSSDHPVAALSELLAIMESSQVKASGRELYRVVARTLDDDDGRLSPRDAVSNSLAFWREHRAAVQKPVYLVYSLLRHCLARGWLDECELVVGEIVERRLSGVPCNSLVDVLDGNETRGEFERNVRMCELLLKSLARPAFRSLNQQFFESYLKALLCTGRFDKVCEQHARLKLGKRFAKSAPIAVALREAKAQQA